jgi:SAM-dependent methyltransferase
MVLGKEETKIKKLFNSLNKHDEFEVMFNNFRGDNKLSLNKFVNVLKFLKWRSDKENIKLTNEDSLDIIYMEDNMKDNMITNYRVSIIDNDNINNFLKLVHLRKNHIIYSILMTQFLNDTNFKFIKKTKDPVKIINVDEYDIRFRVSSELEFDNKTINYLANLPLSQSERIVYRYKNRISLKLIDTPNEQLSIDLTIVKTSDNPNEIRQGKKSYELEVDYSTSTKLNEKILTKILEEIESIKKVLDETMNITDKSELNEVENKYKNLVYGSNNDSYKNLYSMQPISAEVQHIIDKVPNKYSVTDKADGDKYVVFIYNDYVYLITTNLTVKKTNYMIKGYNNTIVEGELIHLTHLNKYLYMGFDCLFYKGEDIRTKTILRDRLDALRDVCHKLTSTDYKFNEYKVKSGKSFDIDEQKKFCQTEIKNFYSIINKLIEKSKPNDIVFHSKLFIFPTGGSNSEVFLFSYLIWYNCTKNENINCPYTLDGVIYTGIEQKYTRDKRDQKYPIYKFKPPEMNSLDVYIEFQRNEENATYLDIFDNSLPDTVEDQYFRVTNFYVGDMAGTKEIPVPFMKENENHEAFLPIVKGQVRDIQGNIVQSNTVIEVVYNNDPSIPHQYRWSVLRTRWDKTDSVMRYGKRYGNFKDIAFRVWKSMIEAVTIQEIKNMSNPDSYMFQKKQLEARIDSSVIASDRKQDKYYQKITNLAKVMREFHNWVKSVIIYTYCQEFKETTDSKLRRANVLDIGCGRGGDILKFYHSRVGHYVGFDPSYEDIYSSTDGAISRYKPLKEKFPGFGKVNYIQADGGVLLNSKEQSKAIPNLSAENKGLIDKIFSKKNYFDIINSSFAIHYLFGNNLMIKNLIQNIKDNLRVGGFVTFEIFDAEAVMKSMGDKNSLTAYYTDEDGKKVKCWDIVKKFNGDLTDEPGQAVDVHMSWFMEENKYQEEYLVSRKLIISTMKKAGCMLVDSESFGNIYKLNKPYFTNVIEHEENPKNKKFYEKVAKFYDNLKGADKESKVFSFLNRYYIFKRIE